MDYAHNSLRLVAADTFYAHTCIARAAHACNICMYFMHAAAAATLMQPAAFVNSDMPVGRMASNFLVHICAFDCTLYLCFRRTLYLYRK